MTDNYSRGETGSHGHKTIIQTQTGRAEVCQVKHLHALEQLKIAHGGKQVKEFQFQYSRHPASCANMKRIGTSSQIHLKCIGIELTYLMAFVLVADEGAGRDSFILCFLQFLNYVFSTLHSSAQYVLTMYENILYIIPIPLYPNCYF